MATPALSGGELEAIHALGHTIQASRIALVIGIGIFASDYFSTLAREVRFYWGGRLSIPRILYFVIRYINFPIQVLNGIGFFNPPSDKFCTGYVNAQIGLDLLLIWSVQAILVFRISAAYGVKPLRRFLWGLLSIVIMSEAVLGFLGINFQSSWLSRPFVSLFPNLAYCTPNGHAFLQKTHYLTWVPTLVFDSIIFTLSLIKFIQFRSTSTPGVFKKSIMWTLLHDSIIYFAFLLIVAIAYMVVTRIDVVNGEPASNIIFPLISAAGCRLLFHIRTKEREKVLGIDHTTFARENRSPLITEELVDSRPIEFRVFSRSEHTGIDTGWELSNRDLFEETFPAHDLDLQEDSFRGGQEQERAVDSRTGEDVRDPPRSDGEIV